MPRELGIMEKGVRCFLLCGGNEIFFGIFLRAGGRELICVMNGMEILRFLKFVLDSWEIFKI